MSVTKGEVRKVIALRKKGATWPEVLEQLDKGPSFVFAVRKEMKTIDPESVRKSYDRQPKAKKVAAKKVTRKTRKVAVSA